MRREIPPGKEAGKPGEKSEHHQRRKAAPGRAAGEYADTGMMILALAMRHCVERPATGMGGGTKKTYGAVCPPPSEPSLKIDREIRNPHGSSVRILS